MRLKHFKQCLVQRKCSSNAEVGSVVVITVRMITTTTPTITATTADLCEVQYRYRVEQ